MTTPPRTYTLTEQQRLLVSEALAMLAAQRHARRSARSRERAGQRAYGGVREVSRAIMETDQVSELDALRTMFRTDSRP
jgi:hypothetical protein